MSGGTLESRYQRLLALLPAAYRERRAEEMLGMLLDGAADGQRWPRAAEVASVAGLAVRLRTGAAGGSLRAAAFGEVLRRLALAALTIQTLYYAAGFFVGMVGYLDQPSYVLSSPAAWMFATIGCESALSAAALVCLVRGGNRAGRLLAALSAVVLCVSLGQEVAAAGPVGYVFPAELALSLSAPLAIGLVGVAAVLLGFHRDAPLAAVPGRWPRILAVSLLFVLACAGTAQVLDDHSIAPNLSLWLNAAAHLTVAPVTPAVAVLYGISRTGRSMIWSTGLLLLSIPVIALAIPFVSLLIDHMSMLNLTRDIGPALLSGGSFEDVPWEAFATQVILAAACWSAMRRRGAPTPTALTGVADPV